ARKVILAPGAACRPILSIPDRIWGPFGTILQSCRFVGPPSRQGRLVRVRWGRGLGAWLIPNLQAGRGRSSSARAEARGQHARADGMAIVLPTDSSEWEIESDVGQRTGTAANREDAETISCV